MLSPRMADAITEHSMCHPGRPCPHGEGQDGSPGFDVFQRAKSAADLRPVVFARAPETDIKRNITEGRGYVPSPSSNNSLFPLLHGSNLAYE